MNLGKRGSRAGVGRERRRRFFYARALALGRYNGLDHACARLSRRPIMGKEATRDIHHMAAFFWIIRLAVLAASVGFAAAQTPAQFYKGKSVELVCGCGEGGGYDNYARLLSRHMGEHIPGAPSVVVRNVPGAGGFIAVNQAYNSAPRDGTTIGLGPPTIGLDERLGTKGVHFKTSELNWLGRANPNINIVMTWKTSAVKTIADAMGREIVLSTTGVGSTGAIYPIVANNMLGTKFKLIMGYRGASEAMLAMERGEAEGHSVDWEGLKAAHPDWIAHGDINIILQFALSRHPDMKDVPAAPELAKDDEQRSVINAIMNATEVGMSFFTTPGVPKDRVEALRRAFDETMKDPAFLDDARRVRADISPMDGEHVQALIASVANLPADILEKVRAVYVQGE
jgi:tripartite-type tricarboxylate transporter receptor subunit TctC